MSVSPITVSEIFNYFHLVIVTTFSFFLKHKDMNKYTDKIMKICMQKRKKGEKKGALSLYSLSTVLLSTGLPSAGP